MMETDSGKLYIPVQRTGSLEEEADVTLKLVDLTARYGENYEARILDERISPELIYGGESVIDVILNGYDQQEVETLNEDEFAESVYEAGGAELMDANGNPVGVFTTYPVDEDGNPIAVDEQTAADTDEAGEAALMEESVSDTEPEAAQSGSAGAVGSAGGTERRGEGFLRYDHAGHGVPGRGIHHQGGHPCSGSIG